MSAETQRVTAPVFTPGARLNLERALRVGDELGGHIVTGHVDGIGTVLSAEPDAGSTRVTIDAPANLAPTLAPKGSVALDGISLTVNEVAGNRFGINVIPHTLTVTTWQSKKPGDPVNLEVDLFARYVARLLEYRR